MQINESPIVTTYRLKLNEKNIVLGIVREITGQTGMFSLEILLPIEVNDNHWPMIDSFSNKITYLLQARFHRSVTVGAILKTRQRLYSDLLLQHTISKSEITDIDHEISDSLIEDIY